MCEMMMHRFPATPQCPAEASVDLQDAHRQELRQPDNSGIELRNFGIFEVRKRAARKARNPKTGDTVMANVAVVNNSTVARIEDGVRIGAFAGESAPDVSVKAVTLVELGHVSGNVRSVLNKIPDIRDFRTIGAKESFSNMIQTAWGNQAQNGVGFGIIFNWIDNDAIAEIGAAILNVNNVNVYAQTKGFNICIGVCASKTENLGVNGTIGATIFQSDARARIAAGARITAAGNVDVHLPSPSTSLYEVQEDSLQKDLLVLRPSSPKAT